MAASALLTGVVTGLVSQAAHATTAVQLFVLPAVDGGSDTGNNCTLQANPCATIGHAITEEGILSAGSSGSVINVAAGTYNTTGAGDFFSTLTAANANVTITGAGIKGKSATVVSPQACAQLPAVTDTESTNTGFQAIVVMDVQGAFGPDTQVTGVTVENMDLNGGGVAGGACPAYQAAVIVPQSATGSAVEGNLIQSGTTFGILVSGDTGLVDPPAAGQGPGATIISNSLAPVLCTATVKGPNFGLNADWTTPANLKVNKIPKCTQFIESGQHGYTGIFINGKSYCAHNSATKNVIVITGTGPGCAPVNNPPGGPEIASGSQVVFNTSAVPFTSIGISCGDPATATADPLVSCAISDNTVTAGGTVYTKPIGILVTNGADANVDGNTVSGVADAAGMGLGIALTRTGSTTGAGDLTVVGINKLPTPNTGNGNKLSSNDTGILVQAQTAAGNPGYQVNGNTVSSGNAAGIVLIGLGVGHGHLATALDPNSVSGVLLGVGLEMQGDVGQTIGGSTPAKGNSFNGNGVGIVTAPCATADCIANGGPTPNSGNLIQNNKVNNNAGFGVLILGEFQPHEFAASVGPLESTDTYNANTWTGNGTATQGANVLDGTGWGNNCQSSPGVCDQPPGAANTLTYKGANVNSAKTLTLAVCASSGAGANPVPKGSQIVDAADPNLGTFYVTADAIVPQCSTLATVNLSVQAVVNGAKLGSFIIGTLDTLKVNDNGAAAAYATDASVTTYGAGPALNSCTPAIGVFGSATGSATLNAGTGGVNATYDNC